MRTTRVLLAALAALAALAIAGPAAAADAPGSAYVLSNSPFGNAVLAYDRSADGSLTPAGSFPTGGPGTGAGLGSQGAVVLAAATSSSSPLTPAATRSRRSRSARTA